MYSTVDISLADIRIYVYDTIDTSLNDIRSHVYDTIDTSLNDIRSHVYDTIDTSLNDIRSHMYSTVDISLAEIRSHVYDTIDTSLNDIRTHVYDTVDTSLNDIRSHVYDTVDISLADIRSHVYDTVDISLADIRSHVYDTVDISLADIRSHVYDTIDTSLNDVITKLGINDIDNTISPIGDISANSNLYLQGQLVTYSDISANGTIKIGQTQISVNGVDSLIITNGTTGVKLDKNSNEWVSSSDIRLKTNIEPIPNSLDKILQLTGYTYNLKTDLSNQKVGLIAQEVLQVLPQAVSQDTEGFLGVRYTNLIPLLINGMQELQNQISVLKAELDELKASKN